LSSGGTLKIIAAIKESPVITKILTHLGLLARARPEHRRGYSTDSTWPDFNRYPIPAGSAPEPIDKKERLFFLYPALSEPHIDARLKHLTRQELEILNLACDGKSSKEIADVLGMAYNAVQENAQTINRKLGIENLPEADRRCEMHRLCAAVADLLTDDPARLPSGRNRSVARRDPSSRKSIAAVPTC
jgi:DNA-binding CsgD family transcriptional regulator